MTPDAIQKAMQLQAQITEATGIRGIHINAVAAVFKELAGEEQQTITAALDAIHLPRIAALQQALDTLDGNYRHDKSAADTE